MQEFIKVMKALSDPNRVKIVKMLQHRVLCVCEIRAALGLAQSTASKHLKVLEEAGLISSDKEGLWVNYRLAGGCQSAYASVLLGCIRHWLENDRDVSEMMVRLNDIDRETVCGK